MLECADIEMSSVERIARHESGKKWCRRRNEVQRSLVMRKPNRTPSIAPSGPDQTVYIVLDDLGRLGRAYCQTEVDRSDLESIIDDLVLGRYNDPVIVVAFNLAERWSQDVSEDVAREIQRRANLACQDLTSSIERFVERHATHDHQRPLRLV
jgi:hypothetical protein